MRDAAAVLSGVPHLDQYSGLWAIEQGKFRDLLGHVETIERLAAHVDETKAARSSSPARAGDYIVEEGVAVIDMLGSMTKYGSSLSAMSHGTVGVRRAVRDAARAPDVKAILLRIDSPGGTVAGTPDLADDVAEAAATKPLVAFLEDMGASAAYWVASQASEVWATKAAAIGSIGTYAAIYDVSAMYAKKGVKARVVKAGAYKGAGVEGTEVTGDQLEEMQRVVDETNAVFLDAVARGRGLDPEAVEKVANGRIFIGGSAKAAGLIDRIGTLDGAHKRLVAGRIAPRPAAVLASITTDGALDMSDQTDATAAASYAQLKAGLVGADAEFVCSQLDQKATLEAAQRAWMAEQQLRLDKTQARADAAEAKVRAAEEDEKKDEEDEKAEEDEKKDEEEKAEEEDEDEKKPAPPPAGGTATSKPLGTKGKTGAPVQLDGVADFEAAVAAELKDGQSTTKAEATLAVAKGQPELHQAYLEALRQQ